MTIIEQIRAEIERRICSIENCSFIEAEFGASERRDGKLIAYKDLLSFLDTLESEKPTLAEGLEEEAESCWRIVFPDGGIETTKMALTYDEFMMCARHFAQWGAEHLKK